MWLCPIISVVFSDLLKGDDAISLSMSDNNVKTVPGIHPITLFLYGGTEFPPLVISEVSPQGR